MTACLRPTMSASTPANNEAIKAPKDVADETYSRCFIVNGVSPKSVPIDTNTDEMYPVSYPKRKPDMEATKVNVHTNVEGPSESDSNASEVDCDAELDIRSLGWCVSDATVISFSLLLSLLPVLLFLHHIFSFSSQKFTSSPPPNPSLCLRHASGVC